MPVPVIPTCAISHCIPLPICYYKSTPPLPPPPPYVVPAKDAEKTKIQMNVKSSPIRIPNYCPELPPPPSGSILTIMTKTIPSGYLMADGSEVSRISYDTLFSVIGSYYGDGDGVTTFNLPNLSQDGSNNIVLYIIKI